ncbi:Uncharacterised protein [Mycobacteroides abscessus subsp. massiliense]|nr:Uncharacterised protein [Mycobacteroides abscessus subsp. massiliense]SLI28321.1 Uncharacterised protein [Mycobacteroides abscessus subsp. massiliense]
MLAWAQENNPWDPESFVDGLIAAANSIPEGAPVGTIARRPDGRWIGVRDDRRRDARGLAVRWLYAPLHESAADWPANDDADSWPQIRPDQWHDQSGLNWFPPGEEPLVPRPDPTAQQEPEDPGPPSNAHIKLAKPPRTPRVVDRLGVDEQGSPWRELLNGWAWVYLYDPKTDRWQRQTPNGRVKRYKPGAEPHRRGPFIEWGDPS